MKQWNVASNRGRAPAASPEEVLALTRARYLSGAHLDVSDLATELGVGRATIYRWFGTRERLLAEVVAREIEGLVEGAAQALDARGATGLLEAFDGVYLHLRGTSALRRFLAEQHGIPAINREIRRRAIRVVRGLLEREAVAGRYVPAAESRTLASALVRLAEATLREEAMASEGDDSAGGEGKVRDGEEAALRDVIAALLGIPPNTAAPAAPPEPISARQLRLRPLARGDEVELLRIHELPEVAQWWDAPPEGFPWEEPESIRLTIEVDGAVAGMVQYAEEREPKYRHASIDLFLDPELHGQGIGTEVVRRVAFHLITEYGHHRITIDPATGNTAAIRAYAKAGFRPVGVMHAAERDASGWGWHDSLLMELLA